MMKKLLSSLGSFSWGLFKTEFVLIDFSSGIEDLSWAAPETQLCGRTGRAVPLKKACS